MLAHKETNVNNPLVSPYQNKMQEDSLCVCRARYGVSSLQRRRRRNGDVLSRGRGDDVVRKCTRHPVYAPDTEFACLSACESVTSVCTWLAMFHVCAIAVTQRSQETGGDKPTTPRTVIDASESESVPVVVDSVVHKRGAGNVISFLLVHALSLSSDPVNLAHSFSLTISFSSLRAAYSRRRVYTRFRPIASNERADARI